MGHTQCEAQRAVGGRGIAQMPKKEVGSILSICLPSPVPVRGSVQGIAWRGEKKCVY